MILQEKVAELVRRSSSTFGGELGDGSVRLSGSTTDSVFLSGLLSGTQEQFGSAAVKAADEALPGVRVCESWHAYRLLDTRRCRKNFVGKISFENEKALPDLSFETDL